MPIKIAVAARKGGVGKTTIAIGVAAVLAAKGRRVLVVDLDPQSNAAYGLGADPTAAGTAEWLLGESPQPIAITDNLAVLPGGPALAGHEIAALHPDDLADLLADAPFDVVVIDLPPFSEHLERLGLTAADVALVPVDPHPYAIGGAARVLARLRADFDRSRRGPSRWALVGCRLDARRSLDRELDAQLARALPDVPRLRLRQDVALALASTDRVPITQAAPKCRAIADLAAIVEWIES